MAYHIIHELTQTIRQSPTRAAMAAVLLITTAIYVCAGHEEYRVAEIGQPSSTEEVIDLTGDSGWITEIEQVVADEHHSPATTTQVAGRETYIDAHLTHAVAEEGESLQQVEQISAQVARPSPSYAPIWLLGVLSDD